MSQDQPTDEEMRAAFEEQLGKLHVEDVILQALVTLVNLGGRRLGLAGDPAERDLAQARMAIDAVRGLLPVLPGEDLRPLRDALAQLQMAYAREVGTGAAPPPPGPPPPPGSPPPPGAPSPPRGPAPAPQPSDEAERAKARARIWTPGSP